MKNKWLFWAGVSGFFCVAFGAFTAHLLEKRLDLAALIWIEKGLKYQMFHTLALLGLGLFEVANNAHQQPACRRRVLNLIGGSWLVGIALFSGSLYALALEAAKTFVWVTPVGGLAFLLGWATLIYLSVRKQRE